MKRVAILGSTGSIGTQALQIARHLGRDAIEITALAAHSSVDLLEEQFHLFHPKLIAVYERSAAQILRQRLQGLCEVLEGDAGMQAVATAEECDFVLSAITGSAGLKPTLSAIEAGKEIGLANKEVLVSGGDLVMQAAARSGSRLLPIDSEHSALFQCLIGEKSESIKRLILTASGGPFLHATDEALQRITPKLALDHPNWKMGPKVTVDSSTLMNKGLEVIEAHYLFAILSSAIDVVIHPQSIVHSMVEFVDGSIKAQMSAPDMRLPIQYAMTWPKRQPGVLPPFDFVKNGRLDFYEPDYIRFPCLRLAFEALKEGGTAPCYLNGANEILVQRFLQGDIAWQQIGFKLDRLLQHHKTERQICLETILDVDRLARKEALRV